MQQTLTAKINIPEGFLLVKEEEVQKLEEMFLKGKVWTMKDLCSHIGKSPETIKEVLYKYRNELESFVRFPERKGQPWRFNALKMSEWLDKNMNEVL